MPRRLRIRSVGVWFTRWQIVDSDDTVLLDDIESRDKAVELLATFKTLAP